MSASPFDPQAGRGAGAHQGDADQSSPDPASDVTPNTATLIAQLDQDRLWLLRQIDSGLWPDWRLDLAALERELGQLLDQARDRLAG
ncbi:MAG: hypothetical protein ACKOXO_11515 [Cyanobium sp.]